MSSQARIDFDAFARGQIMQTLAAHLIQGGGELTYKALAERSGVPERTLYRRFPSKAALMEAFWLWANQGLDLPPPPGDEAELVAWTDDLFAAYDRQEPVVRAMIHDPGGRLAWRAHAAPRRARFETCLEGAAAGLPVGRKADLLACVQTLQSAAAWESMKDVWGFSGARAAQAVQWALRALLDAARAEAAPGGKA